MNFHIDSLIKKEALFYSLSFAIFAAAAAKIAAIGITVALPANDARQKPFLKEDTNITQSVSALFKGKNTANGGVAVSSSQGLKLKAIFKSGQNSFALFGDADKSFFLALGESKNGVKLENILYEKAILSRGSERLELSLEYAYFPNSQKAAQESAQKSSSISKELLGAYIQNPSAMMEDIRLDVKNGAVFIASLKGGTLFDIAGFRQNDVILSLDGATIKNPVDLVGALKNLSEKTAFSALIDRNGVKKEMKYEIK